MKAKFRSRIRNRACLVVFAVALSWPWSGQAEEETVQDLLQSSVDAESISIVGDQMHRQAVVLAAGDFFHVVVEQQGIDLAVALVDPGAGPRTAPGDRKNWSPSSTGPDATRWK